MTGPRVATGLEEKKKKTSISTWCLSGDGITTQSRNPLYLLGVEIHT